MTHLHRRTTPLVIAFVLLVTTPDSDRLNAQAPAASQKPLQFEVASVKPTLSPAEAGREAGRRVAAGEFAAAAPVFFGIRTFPGGRLSAVASLRGLIARAYNVKDYQIEGGPAWASSDYFAIEARAGGDATTAEFNEMLKALLAERFSLRAHMEARQGKVYALTFARSDRRLGSGLKRTSDECLQRIEERKKTPPPQPGTSSVSNQALRWSPTDPADCGTSRIMGSISSTNLSFSGQPMSALVDHISGELAAPVVDRTGLDGAYDVFIEYEPRRFLLGNSPVGLDPNSTESPKLPLPNAIERQLGLKLEATTGDIPTVVIVSAEKPSPD